MSIQKSLCLGAIAGMNENGNIKWIRLIPVLKKREREFHATTICRGGLDDLGILRMVPTKNSESMLYALSDIPSLTP